MTRSQFVAKAVRAEEKREGLPAGWWGSWREVQGPGGVRVLFSNGAWSLSLRGKLVSRHDSRPSAIKKGRALAE